MVMKRIPILLIVIRLLLGCVILFWALTNATQTKFLMLALLYVGILSDIFDGIIARKLNISTDNLRFFDTLVDLLFYLAIVFYLISNHSKLVFENLPFVAAILALESFMYLTSFVRFRKFPSPHAILSKFWGLYLIVEFTLLILDVGGSHFRIALFFGFVAHLDRVLIYLLLPSWQHDIPSAWHANELRHGRPIHRRKIFNG